MAINIDILRTLIKNQKDAIRYQTVFASIVILLGLILIMASVWFINNPDINDAIKLILGIGGGFISTISAFPINQIISRLEKIKTYELFCLKMNSMSEMELLKIEELIWKSIEKII